MCCVPFRHVTFKIVIFQIEQFFSLQFTYWLLIRFFFCKSCSYQSWYQFQCEMHFCSIWRHFLLSWKLFSETALCRVKKNGHLFPKCYYHFYFLFNFSMWRNLIYEGTFFLKKKRDLDVLYLTDESFVTVLKNIFVPTKKEK